MPPIVVPMPIAVVCFLVGVELVVELGVELTTVATSVVNWVVVANSVVNRVMVNWIVDLTTVKDGRGEGELHKAIKGHNAKS